MSEFDKIKDEGEKYAQEHPEQVRKAEQKAEQAGESKLGIGGQQGQQGQQDENAEEEQQDGQQGQ